MNGGHVELWAWDGTIWRKVLIDAAGNLQVDVLTAPQNNVYGYDPAGVLWRPLEVQVLGGYHAWSHYALIVNAMNYVWDASISGFVPVPAHVTVTRRTAVGQVGAAGAHMLYWVSMNPSAADSEAALSDDTDGSTATLFDMFHTARDHMHMVLSPPMEFTTGIYLKTINKMTSMMFGYV